MGANFGQRKGGLGKDNKTFTKIIDWYGNKIEKFVKKPIHSFILVSYSYYSKGTVYFAIVDPVKAEISIRGRGNLSSTEKKEIIQDVAWDGYEEVPKLTMAGYAVMMKEISDQTNNNHITHIFLQAGVGGMAAAMIDS